MTGLGNLSTAGGTQMGVALADELPAARDRPAAAPRPTCGSPAARSCTR
jgi:hypothetical protein